jgi:hypothetical protein
MNALHELLENTIAEASKLARRSTEELHNELMSRKDYQKFIDKLVFSRTSSLSGYSDGEMLNELLGRITDTMTKVVITKRGGINLQHTCNHTNLRSAKEIDQVFAKYR